MEGDQDVGRIMHTAMDLGVLSCGFWLFASRSKGKEGQDRMTELSDSICLISVLFWKIIFIVMSPKTTSPFKQES